MVGYNLSLIRRVIIQGILCIVLTIYDATLFAMEGIWLSRSEIKRLPTSGQAWDAIEKTASKSIDLPNLANKDDRTNVQVLAKALVYVRLNKYEYREAVINALKAAMGTENGGNTLALGRELAAYVIAADLVGLPDKLDKNFRSWLHSLLDKRLERRSLRTTHEERPNNWGTHAGASRAAIAAYLKDKKELERVAQVFKGYLGDRRSFAKFRFRDRSWQASPGLPVGINPKGSMKNGRNVDGVIPDDQRRSGPFRWPPPKENYVYEALQGALVQAVILSRAGYDVWNWSDQALLRAFNWLHHQAHFPAIGDDTWQPHLINFFYSVNFPAPSPSRPGKNMGWTDWTHGSR